MRESRVYSVFGGSLLTIAMRWTDRAIAVISTIILARLLAPDDFGIIAMAALAIALADVLLNFGVHVALVRDPGATKAHFDTAWTIRLIQTALSTLILFLAAPYAGVYFEDQRLEPVLQFLAFSLLLGGLENIGLVEFQKKMQFGAEFHFLFIRRLAQFFITVALAWILRSYWAMVAGALAGRVVSVVLSYRLHSMRPALSFEKFKEIFGVSQWMLISNIASYLQQNLHKILVARWASTSVVGAYSLADDISAMPSTELLAPINRALFPAFAKAQQIEKELKGLFVLALAVQTTIAVPVAAGLALVATEAVPVLLGEQWLIAIPFVEILALVNIVQAMSSSSFYVLLAIGKVRMSAIFTWVQVLLFGGLAMTILRGGTAVEIGFLRLVVVVAGLSLLFALLIRSVPSITTRDVVSAVIRPLVAAATMALAVFYLSSALSLPLVTLLVAKVAIGVIVYVSALYVLWSFTGRPSGAESYFLLKIREFAAR